MSVNVLTVQIRYEQDVVLTRQRARQIAASLGFSSQDQTALATAVSELARNAFRYASGGRVEFSIRTEVKPHAMVIRITDSGPGIANLTTILNGQYRSATGMGLGILGSKRLSDEFDIDSTPEHGTRIEIAKRLPFRSGSVTPLLISEITTQLSKYAPGNPLEELQQQNKELLQTMDNLRARQFEVERLNEELAETNRGVVALYAELDEKADILRRASELKTRFLSDMTHELRTPLNAMISLSRLLLDKADGDLTSEQSKQVSFIHNSATSLGEMVNDLLDIARIEAGKTDVYISEFVVADHLLALRGMFRALSSEGGVGLEIEQSPDVTTMQTDERKLSQILRNLVSNALKFTEKGKVRLRADAGPDHALIFTVNDTGVGISEENIPLIFEDFTQIDSTIQRRVRGTGLGLPLTRKLARLLGGDVSVQSVLGAGSTFTVVLPKVCPTPTETARIKSESRSQLTPAGAIDG